MKQGTLITRIIMFVLCGGVALYIAVYAVRSLSAPLSTTVVYRDVLNDAVEITGVVAREEAALSSGTAIMDILPDEGERVRAGETVALLYQSSEALEREKQIQALEQERDQLLYALNSSGSLEDAAKLEKQIVSSLLTLRASAAAGDLSTLESDALALRAEVLRREFAYTASNSSSVTLSESISVLEQQISALQAQASYDTTPVRAQSSSLFSGMTDGLESVLTPEALETISAEQLASVSSGTSSSDGTGVGKLITGERWYFAAVVDPSTASRLQLGDTITVAFSRDFTGEVTMRVDRIGPEEPAGCVLVLSSNRHLRDVTLLRTQTVSLIFHRYTGIRVPKQALRMETQMVTDPDTGKKIEKQFLGIYAVSGGRAEFKKVDIVREGSDYYLVSPTDSTNSKRLRAGDTIIVEAPDLYNGKVILEWT